VFTLSQTHHLREQSKVCILLRKDHDYLLELWPNAADHSILLTTQQFELLRSLEDFSFRHPGHLFICWADLFADGRFGLDLVLNNNRITMKEMYSYALGISFNCPPAPPNVQHLNFKPPESGARRNVLLIPHANTIARIPGEFWKALSDRMLAMGCQLTVDIVSEADIIHPPHPQIKHVRTRVTGLLAIARASDCVIALRSGIADLIGAMVPHSAPHLNMIVVYHVTSMFGKGPRSFHHSAGISLSGLSLSRSFDCKRIFDSEVASDDREQLLSEEVDRIAGLAASRLNLSVASPT